VRIIPLYIPMLASLLLVADSAVAAGQQATSGTDTTSARTIAPVIVTAEQRDRALDHVGFAQRSQHSVGHYLTADQISRMSGFKFSDLLRTIPGIRVGIDKYGEDVVTSPRAGGSLLSATNGCVQYIIDGIPWTSGAVADNTSIRDSAARAMLRRIALEQARQLNMVLHKSDILGIEVYQGGGTPAQFNQGGGNCATILVWTTASAYK